MPSIDQISGTVDQAAHGRGHGSERSARTPKQTMDGEMFMKLLVTQLKNQDPSSPMDTNAMIGADHAAGDDGAGHQPDHDRATRASRCRCASRPPNLVGQQVSYKGPDGKRRHRHRDQRLVRRVRPEGHRRREGGRVGSHLRHHRRDQPCDRTRRPATRPPTAPHLSTAPHAATRPVTRAGRASQLRRKAAPMLRSLYSGISGLRSHQTMLDVTGNNIANVNTAGFKSLDHAVPGHPVADDRRAPAARRPASAARTPPRSASACRSRASRRTSPRARRRPPARRPT